MNETANKVCENWREFGTATKDNCKKIVLEALELQGEKIREIIGNTEKYPEPYDAIYNLIDEN